MGNCLYENTDNACCSMFYSLLGLKVLDFNKGVGEMYLPVSEKILNPNGEINQGICMAVCDYAGFFAACTLMGDGEYPAAYNSNISVFSRIGEGGLKIYTQVIEGEYGSSIIEVKVFDEKSNQIAQGTIILLKKNE